MSQLYSGCDGDIVVWCKKKQQQPKNPKNLENVCLHPAKPAPPVYCVLQAQAARAMPQSEKPAHARLNV